VPLHNFSRVQQFQEFNFYLQKEELKISATLDIFCKAEAISNIEHTNANNGFQLYLHDAASCFQNSMSWMHCSYVTMQILK
jgi:hypothetical protein